MNSKLLGFQATEKFLPTVRLDKNLRTRKGSRRGNSGNHLELQTRFSSLLLGGSQVYMTKNPCGDWDNASRKSGFQALQKKEQEKKEAQVKQQQTNKYGAWGPTFKNKEHFASLHHC
ncbi:hypothetical protein CBL_12049 [Carabus blaptoides fortunei]